MTRQNKTILVAVWPDGYRHEVRKVYGAWEYGPNCQGYPLRDTIWQAENLEGVKFHREPNPRYREVPPHNIVAQKLNKILGPLMKGTK